MILTRPARRTFLAWKVEIVGGWIGVRCRSNTSLSILSASPITQVQGGAALEAGLRGSSLDGRCSISGSGGGGSNDSGSGRETELPLLLRVDGHNQGSVAGGVPQLLCTRSPLHAQAVRALATGSSSGSSGGGASSSESDSDVEDSRRGVVESVGPSSQGAEQEASTSSPLSAVAAAEAAAAAVAAVGAADGTAGSAGLMRLRVRLREDQAGAGVAAAAEEEDSQALDIFAQSRTLAKPDEARPAADAGAAAAAAAATAPARKELGPEDQRTLSKLVGCMTKEGKRSRAQGILNEALHIISAQLRKGRAEAATKG